MSLLMIVGVEKCIALGLQIPLRAKKEKRSGLASTEASTMLRTGGLMRFLEQL